MNGWPPPSLAGHVPGADRRRTRRARHRAVPRRAGPDDQAATPVSPLIPLVLAALPVVAWGARWRRGVNTAPAQGDHLVAAYIVNSINGRTHPRRASVRTTPSVQPPDSPAWSPPSPARPPSPTRPGTAGKRPPPSQRRRRRDAEHPPPSPSCPSSSPPGRSTAPNKWSG